MEGKNFVELVGKIIKPSVKMVGDNNTLLFKATLAIPAPNGGFQYQEIASFNCAEALGELKAGTFIKLNGHIEKRSYDTQCRHCGGPDKKFWMEVVVDNFVTDQEV